MNQSMGDDSEIRETAKEGAWLQAFHIVAELRDSLTRESSPEYVEERRSRSIE